MKLIASFWNSHPIDIHSAGVPLLILAIGVYFLRKKPESVSVKATKAKKKAKRK